MIHLAIEDQTECPTCGGCRVASLTWSGGDQVVREVPCPDCRPVVRVEKPAAAIEGGVGG